LTDPEASNESTSSVVLKMPITSTTPVDDTESISTSTIFDVPDTRTYDIEDRVSDPSVTDTSIETSEITEEERVSTGSVTSVVVVISTRPSEETVSIISVETKDPDTATTEVVDIESDASV
jgi:hypothetical protein